MVLLWLAFLLMISYHIAAKTTYDGCLFELTDTNGMTAEYDLSYFNLQYDVFTVIDKNNPYFKYQFNICGAINALTFTANKSIPHQCAHPSQNHGPCLKPASDNKTCLTYEKTSGAIPSAVQVDTRGNTSCFWLGMELTETARAEYKKELLDPNDAGKGVIFTILNGEWCPAAERNRELRVKLECPDEARIEFEPGSHQTDIQKSVVEEFPTCVYEVAVVSPLACPNKCISRMNFEMFSVCGMHGICEADPYGKGDDYYPNGTIRCLCDDGYAGDICEDINSEIRVIDQTHPGLLAAIVICIILLGVAIVMAAVLCHKIRMKELEEAQSVSHLSGGMLQEANDAALQHTKDDAMTMHIGSQLMGGGGGGSAAVQLQTVDDHLEKDKKRDTNELLDEENEEEEEEEEEEVEQTQEIGNNIKTQQEDDNEDITPDAGEEEEEETTNPGGD